MIINQASDTNKNNIKMFFVDRDFNDNVSLSNDIYVTPTYSIENLYFTDSALKNMIKGEMGLSDHSEQDILDLKIAFGYLVDLRDKVIGEVLYGNACYSLQVKKSFELGKSKPNLSSIKRYEDIKSICKVEEIRCKISDFIEISEYEIEQECLRLSAAPITLIRGKYLLEKMPKFINKIVEESNKAVKNGKHMFSKKRYMSLNTSEKSLLSDLSSYADTPTELTNYIKEKCQNIV